MRLFQGDILCCVSEKITKVMGFFCLKKKKKMFKISGCECKKRLGVVGLGWGVGVGVQSSSKNE